MKKNENSAFDMQANRLRTLGSYFVLYIIFIVFMVSVAHAEATDIYQFATQEQQTRFAQLTHEFRCLVCQNESLADSNAPLAADLRADIAKQIKQGSSDEQITAYLVHRYGDFVLFRPPLKSTTFFLWFGPFILLLVGFVTCILYVRKFKIDK